MKKKYIGIKIVEAEPMTFGMAIEAMKLGHKIARAGWNDKNMYLVLVVDTYDHASDSVEVFNDIAIEDTKFLDNPTGKMVPTDAYIVMRTAQGSAQPGWLASQADMLAEDWGIVE